VTIVLRHNAALELNLVEYLGAITPAQLKALAAYGARHPGYLRTDTLNIVREGADFDAVDLPALDALFERFRKLYAPLELTIYRRSAWLCRSPAAAAYIDYWVGVGDMRKTLSSTVGKFETLAEAGEWLLLSDADVAQVERGEGFTELARFGPARACRWRPAGQFGLISPEAAARANDDVAFSGAPLPEIKGSRARGLRPRLLAPDSEGYTRGMIAGRWAIGTDRLRCIAQIDRKRTL
jgi:hypothetical protein